MADIYFDLTNGNDTTGDGSNGNPYQTLNKAHTEATAGDVLILKDNTHTLAANVSTTITKNVTIQSEGGEAKNCIIDGDSLYQYVISFVTPLTNLEFKNIQYSNMVDASNLFDIQALSFVFSMEKSIFKNVNTNAGAGIFQNSRADNSTLTLLNCLFDDRSGTAAGNNCIMANLFSVNFTFNVEGCSFVYRTASPGSLGTSFAPTTNLIYNLKNSIFYTETNTGVAIRIVANTVNITNCDLYAAGTTTWNFTGANTTNVIEVDPLFIDLLNSNFNLRPTSPCIDAGTIL